MDLIYLDYNCFQRRFDDPRQTRIQMEALACQDIFIKAQEREVKLIWSFIHQDETNLCPFPERKYAVLYLVALCQVRVGPNTEIYQLAQRFNQEGGLSAKDALHLGCAISGRANVFLSCDDKLIKKARQLNLEIGLMNPVDYIRQENN